jgi:AmiR/NasT family two-component response regulator
MILVEEPMHRVAPYPEAPAPEPSAAQVAQLQQQLEHLKHALETNRVIGVAVGILMERYHLDRPAAFRFLARLSQERNVKVCRIAEGLVRGAEGSGLSG